MLTIQKAISPADRAVRKATRERLLRDFTESALAVRMSIRNRVDRADARDYILWLANDETSRTRYACLMTAFGM